MRMRSYAVLLVQALATTCTPSGAQGGSFDEAVRHESISADLANALAQVAWTFRLPMIAELSQPLPKVRIAEGTDSAKYLLRQIARQAPGYGWEAAGGAIYFYNKELVGARFNFLNLKFRQFAMPSNLSELKLTFPTREYGLLQGYSGGGIIVTGFGDAMLEKDLLQPATLENVTGREILLRAAKESPTFLSVIVFPNAQPTRKEMERDMNRNWFWQALGGQRRGPLYVQPPAATRR